MVSEKNIRIMEIRELTQITTASNIGDHKFNYINIGFIDYVFDIREIMEYRDDCIWVDDKIIEEKRMKLDLVENENNKVGFDFYFIEYGVVYVEGDIGKFGNPRKISYGDWLIKKILE